MKYIDVTTNRKIVCEMLGISFGNIFFPVEHKICDKPGFVIQDYGAEKVIQFQDELTRRMTLKFECQECEVKIKSFNAFWDNDGDAICWSCKEKEINVSKLVNLSDNQ